MGIFNIVICMLGLIFAEVGVFLKDGTSFYNFLVMFYHMYTCQNVINWLSYTSCMQKEHDRSFYRLIQKTLLIQTGNTNKHWVLLCAETLTNFLLLHLREQLQSIVMSMSVCLSARISPEPHAWSLPNFLCMLPMSVTWSSSGTYINLHFTYLLLGRIAYWWKGGDGCAQRGQTVIYDYLVRCVVCYFVAFSVFFNFRQDSCHCLKADVCFCRM